MRAPSAFLALLLLALPAHAQPAPQAKAPPAAAKAVASRPVEKVFNAETFSLINGMQVVVIPNHRVPVVAQMVWYRVGGADEDRGQSGLAHFVEHLMFKGSEHVPPGEFSTRVKAMGGDDNAFTGQDFTGYHQKVTIEHLPEIMEMEADRMRGLLFPPDAVLSERNVVLEERRERTENDPRGYFGEQMKAMLFVNHPYGNPVGGWFNEVDALTRDNVMAFYKKWYTPNNAILVVSGDITAKELEPLANRTFGTIPARDVPERHWTKVPPMLALPQLVMQRPDIQQPTWQRLYRVPSLRQSRDDALALDVLQEIMDGGAATRLYKALAVDQKLASSIDLDYDPFAWDDGVLWISAVPVEGVSMDTLGKAIDAQLRLLIEKGVTDKEMEEARIRVRDTSVFARDSLMGPAMILGRILVTGGKLEDAEIWPSLIDKVTPAQVQDVAKRFLNPDDFARRPYVTGFMLPAAKPEAAP